MEQIIGIDLAKRVFQLNIVSFSGKLIHNKVLPREKLIAFIAQQPLSKIVMEADSRLRILYAPEKRQKTRYPMFTPSPSTSHEKSDRALINQIRGLGLEYSIAMPESTHKVEQCLPEHLEDADNELTSLMSLNISEITV